MDILSAVDEFCLENGIPYSMACGTMLGAVRHQGYIPWDDDIDIYLLRNDYERLMKSFPDVYKNHYCIYSLERNKNWERAYAKACDNRTIVYELADYTMHYGVNIDIFPIDEVPDDNELWQEYDTKRRKLLHRWCGIISMNPFSFTPRRIARWLRNRVFKFLIPLPRMARIIDSKCKQWRGRGYNSVFECCLGLSQKRPFAKSVFGHLVDYPFEDRRFMGFENYDDYLRNGYGDYMQLPPEEKRVSHHHFEAYWIIETPLINYS